MIDFFKESSLLIEALLFLLFLIVLVLYYIDHANRKQEHSSSKVVSKDKYNDLNAKLKKMNSQNEQIRKERDKFKADYEALQDDRIKILRESGSLEKELDDANLKINKLCQEIDELKRKNGELNKLVGNETATTVETKSSNSTSSTDDIQVNNVNESPAVIETSEVENLLKEAVEETPEVGNLSKKEDVAEEVPEDEKVVEETPQKLESPKNENKTIVAKEVIMYASFPRFAGSRIYFSDLTASQEEDSYFVLSISDGKATFKPLEFMKIRNYDEAMAVMQVSGVKPAIATSVRGVEPGIAHSEGKDMFIDKLAKIELR